MTGGGREGGRGEGGKERERERGKGERERGGREREMRERERGERVCSLYLSKIEGFVTCPITTWLHPSSILSAHPSFFRGM